MLEVYGITGLGFLESNTAKICLVLGEQLFLLCMEIVPVIFECKLRNKRRCRRAAQPGRGACEHRHFQPWPSAWHCLMDKQTLAVFFRQTFTFFLLSTQITQKHQLHEASSYLLEKKGDIHGAFLVMLEVQYSQILNVC